MDEIGDVIVPETVNEEVIVVEEKPMPKKLTAWKIVNGLLVLAHLIFVMIFFISGVVIPLAEHDPMAGFGVIAFWMILIYGLAGVVAIAVPCIIATVKAFKKSNNCTKGTKNLCLLLTLFPLLFEVFMFAVSFVLMLIIGD